MARSVLHDGPHPGRDFAAGSRCRARVTRPGFGYFPDVKSLPFLSALWTVAALLLGPLAGSSEPLTGVLTKAARVTVLGVRKMIAGRLATSGRRLRGEPSGNSSPQEGVGLRTTRPRRAVR